MTAQRKTTPRAVPVALATLALVAACSSDNGNGDDAPTEVETAAETEDDDGSPRVETTAEAADDQAAPDGSAVSAEYIDEAPESEDHVPYLISMAGPDDSETVTCSLAAEDGSALSPEDYPDGQFTMTIDNDATATLDLPSTDVDQAAADGVTWDFAPADLQITATLPDPLLDSGFMAECGFVRSGSDGGASAATLEVPPR